MRPDSFSIKLKTTVSTARFALLPHPAVLSFFNAIPKSFFKCCHVFLWIHVNALYQILYPVGEWFSTGYDTSRSGENLVYSDRMMRECCGESRDLWLHFVG